MKKQEFDNLIKEFIIKELTSLDFKPFFDKESRDRKKSSINFAKELIKMYKSTPENFVPLNRKGFRFNLASSEYGFTILSAVDGKDLSLLKSTDAFPGEKPAISAYVDGDLYDYYYGFHNLIKTFDYIYKNVNKGK